VLTFGSVCSGIEAASVAWEPLGWHAAWFAEIDPFASAVLAHRWPGVENRGDFTRIKDESPGSIGVLVGGTPCQSFSVAGRRLGMDDPRGNLAIEFLRLARRLRPLWLVFENVPGFLSSGGGRDFGAFLGLLGQLGYGFAYRVLDAQYFGVPQRRRRVFVVGHLGDWRRAAAVLFERESLSGNPAPRREAGTDVAGCFEAKSGGRLNSSPTLDTRSVNGPRRNQGGVIVAHSLRADGFDASEDGTGRGTPLVPVDLRQASRGGKITNHRSHGSGGPPGVGVGNVGDPAFTVSERGQAIGFIVNAAESCAKQSHARESEVARCIDSNGSFATAQGGTVVAQRSAVRRLTPREAERLQGFPDDFTLVPYRGKPASDGPRYRAVGNSMAVPVMRWIGQRIQMANDLVSNVA
jgi:DNA (cytosine-5)-methyltransferase 1